MERKESQISLTEDLNDVEITFGIYYKHINNNYITFDKRIWKQILSDYVKLKDEWQFFFVD